MQDMIQLSKTRTGDPGNLIHKYFDSVFLFQKECSGQDGLQPNCKWIWPTLLYIKLSALKFGYIWMRYTN